MTEAVDADTFTQLRDTVERFVTERLVPNEMRLEIEDEVPEEIVAEMRAMGLFGLTIPPAYGGIGLNRSEEHTSELQSLMRISYAVFCLKKKNKINITNN